MRRALIGVIATCSLLAPAYAGDATWDHIINHAKSTGMQSFERTMRVEAPGKATTVQVDRFQPAAPQGLKWTLLREDGEAPSVKQVEAHAKTVSKLPIPGYYRLPLLLQGAPSSVKQEGDVLVYHWNKLKKGAVPNPHGPDFSEQLAADAKVVKSEDGPVLKSVRIYSPKPFSVLAVARINHFEAVTHYQLKGGQPFLTSQTTEVNARIPFRASGPVKTFATFRPTEGQK